MPERRFNLSCLVAASLFLVSCAPAGTSSLDPAPACASQPATASLPGGNFAMGEDNAYVEERPVREIRVAAFSIDTVEVTNARFARFVDATGYITDAERAPDPGQHPDIPPEALVAGSAVFISPLLSGSPQWWQFVEGASWRQPEGPGSSIAARMDHPVVHVSLRDARAFAAWAGGDLPNEAEWEYAARGGLSGETYEWGAQAPDEGPVKANTWQGAFPMENEARDGFPGTAPAGCFQANGFGLHDMTGNVWEWTSDPYTLGDPRSGVIKGGSYLCSPNFCQRYRPAARQPHERDFSTSHIGFRLVYRDGASPTDLELD